MTAPWLGSARFGVAKADEAANGFGFAASEAGAVVERPPAENGKEACPVVEERVSSCWPVWNGVGGLKEAKEAAKGLGFAPGGSETAPAVPLVGNSDDGCVVGGGAAAGPPSGTVSGLGNANSEGEGAKGLDALAAKGLGVGVVVVDALVGAVTPEDIEANGFGG